MGGGERRRRARRRRGDLQHRTDADPDADPGAARPGNARARAGLGSRQPALGEDAGRLGTGCRRLAARPAACGPVADAPDPRRRPGRAGAARERGDGAGWGRRSAGRASGPRGAHLDATRPDALGAGAAEGATCGAAMASAAATAAITYRWTMADLAELQPVLPPHEVQLGLDTFGDMTVDEEGKPR